MVGLKRNMQKIIWLSLGSAIVGFIGGLFSAIEAFGGNIDLLAIPYMNTPVVAEQNLVLTQGPHKVEVPEGAVLVYRYTVMGAAHYALEFVGLPGVADPVSTTQEEEIFRLEALSL